MRVLFTPYCGGSIAHVVRSLALADEFRERGHDVLFTASVRKRAFVEAAGYATFGAGHPDVNLNDERDQGAGYFITRRSDFLAWFRDEIAAAEAYRPDLIVNSPTFFGAFASRKLGIPHVSLINGNWHPSYRGVLGLARCGTGPADRAARFLLRPLLERGFAGQYLPEIRRWHEELGIDPPDTRAAIHAGLPAIIPGVPSLEPVRAPESEAKHVGSLQWKGFEREPWEPDFPASPRRKPRVYASLGGSVFREETYRALAAFLSARDDWQTVLTLGPNLDRSRLPNDLPHLRIRQYAPGLALCAWADAVLNTASHGTVMQALAHGRPVVAIPRNIDQATFAARLSELGAGTDLNPVRIGSFAKRESYVAHADEVTTGRIGRAVEEALASGRMHERAGLLADEIAEYGDGASSAADFAERVAGLR